MLGNLATNQPQCITVVPIPYIHHLSEDLHFQVSVHHGPQSKAWDGEHTMNVPESVLSTSLALGYIFFKMFLPYLSVLSGIF